eukprot:SM000053S17482  [mRNA]  locus=s53:756863:757735:+ [translate_table: standard]
MLEAIGQPSSKRGHPIDRGPVCSWSHVAAPAVSSAQHGPELAQVDRWQTPMQQWVARDEQQQVQAALSNGPIDAALLATSFMQAWAACGKLVRKLPLVGLLFILVFCVLPCSTMVLFLYFLGSVFFAIPSSAIAVFCLSSADYLMRKILA